jgi:hypothetical protein
MADPLTAVAEQFAPAPARTQFFSNPSDSEAIARRWETGVRAEAAGELAGAASALEKSRLDREKAQRERLLWGREDQDYEDRKNFEATKGEFLLRFTDKEVLDPDADDYPQRLAQLQSQLPPEAAEDDAVKSLISVFNRRFEMSQMEKRQQADFTRKQQAKAAWEGLSPEERAEIPVDPNTGEPDEYATAYAAGMKAQKRKLEEEGAKRTRDLETFREKENIRSEFRPSMRPKESLSKEAKGLREQAIANIKYDTTAFMNPMDSLRQTWMQEKKMTVEPDEAQLRARFGPNPVTQAKNWTAETEFVVARESATPEEYIKKGGENLTPRQKELRQEVWNIAHGEGQFDAPKGEQPSTAAEQPKVEAEKTVRGVRYIKVGGKWYPG